MATDATHARRERPPWPVVAFLPLAVVWVIVFYRFSDGDADMGRVLSGLLLPLAVGIGLWRRSKLAWWLGVGLNIAAVVFGAALFFGENRDTGLIQFAGGALLLWLLLDDDTRRWCGR